MSSWQECYRGNFMRYIVATILFLCLGGCSVIMTTKNEIDNEIKGFKEDWQRTFGKEQSIKTVVR